MNTTHHPLRRTDAPASGRTLAPSTPSALRAPSPRWRECPRCSGTGEGYGCPCGRCAGRGEVRVTTEEDLDAAEVRG